MKPNVVIGCDHAGVEFKNAMIDWLKQEGYTVTDCGCNGESVDYPDIAQAVCRKVQDGSHRFGVLICGTGIGMSMAANRMKGIRAALCQDWFSAKFTRLHNDSNVICFGARVLGPGLGLELLKVFLETEFEGGRHQRRVDKLTALEQ